MILLPKYRHVVPNKPFESNVGFSGEVRTILYDLNMNIRHDSGWSPNLITNNGMNKLWTSAFWLGYTSIGDGTTPAQFTDTALDNHLASVSTGGSNNNVVVGPSAPDYEFSKTNSKRFAAGIGTGTIREAGTGYNNSGTSLFNRIVLPTPVVKSAENVLDVIFRRTVWPDLTDHVSTAVFKGITYDTITRVGRVDETQNGDAWDVFKIVDSGTAVWIAYDGAIGSITDWPAGTNDYGGTGAGWSSETYVDGNFYRDIRYGAGLNDWVLTNNIRCLVGNLNLLKLQTQFTEATGQPNPGDPVPKDATEIMDFGWRYKWSRRP